RNRTFDRASPPADMPPLGPGEVAECDAHFVVDARVAGQPQRIDATHAVVTVTKVNVKLQLDITIWVPDDATQHVIAHENGHRQIAEASYRNADEVARAVGGGYVGEKSEVAGADLGGEANKLLSQMAKEINAEFNKELDSGPAQTRYDAITDHSRNELAA